MKVRVQIVESEEQEEIIIKYVKPTKIYREIKDFCQNVETMLTVYTADREMKKIPLADILYIEAVGDRVFAYTSKQVYEMKGRLYQLEEQLAGGRMVRASKSTLVNIRHIRSMKPEMNGRMYAKMSNGENIMVSRNYAKELKGMTVMQ